LRLTRLFLARQQLSKERMNLPIQRSQFLKQRQPIAPSAGHRRLDALSEPRAFPSLLLDLGQQELVLAKQRSLALRRLLYSQSRPS
jgi:hypothetical protein